MGFGIILTALGVGCTPEPEASATEKQYNPVAAEKKLEQKYPKTIAGNPQPQAIDEWIPNPAAIIYPTHIVGTRYDYTVNFETPGLKSQNGACEIKSVGIHKEYDQKTVTSWVYRQDPAPEPVYVPAPQVPAPQVPVPQVPSPQVPYSTDPQPQGSNSDYDGNILVGLELFSSPAQAGWEQATAYSNNTKTTFQTEFNYNGSYCTANQVRNDLPENANWRVRKGEMSCATLPAPTEAGLSGERQVADCLGAALSGN